MQQRPVFHASTLETEDASLSFHTQLWHDSDAKLFVITQQSSGTDQQTTSKVVRKEPLFARAEAEFTATVRVAENILRRKGLPFIDLKPADCTIFENEYGELSADSLSGELLARAKSFELDIHGKTANIMQGRESVFEGAALQKLANAQFVFPADSIIAHFCVIDHERSTNIVDPTSFSPLQDALALPLLPILYGEAVKRPGNTLPRIRFAAFPSANGKRSAIVTSRGTIVFDGDELDGLPNENAVVINGRAVLASAREQIVASAVASAQPLITYSGNEAHRVETAFLNGSLDRLTTAIRQIQGAAA